MKCSECRQNYRVNGFWTKLFLTYHKKQILAQLTGLTEEENVVCKNWTVLRRIC